MVGILYMATSDYIPFNSTMFLCNTIHPSSPSVCKQSQSTCISNATTYAEQLDCAICKNQSYLSWYESNRVGIEKYNNTMDQYNRTQMQSFNYGVGILGIGYGIYRLLSL